MHPAKKNIFNFHLNLTVCDNSQPIYRQEKFIFAIFSLEENLHNQIVTENVHFDLMYNILAYYSTFKRSQHQENMSVTLIPH